MRITELLVYGRHLQSEKMIFIDDAVNGKKCNCLCPGCGEVLIARQGQHNTSHFAHANGDQCAYAGESAMHQLAKEIIAENSFIRLPDNVVFNYTESAIEKKICDFRPDAILRNAEKILHIEIFVTHKVGFNKRNFLIAHGLTTIEIDISDLPRGISKDELKNIIIDEISRKQYIREKSDLSLFNPALHEIVITEAVIEDACTNEAVTSEAIMEEAVIEEAVIEEDYSGSRTPLYLKVLGIGIIFLLASWFVKIFFREAGIK